ncbi:MAG: 3-deoxy-7-phosphoheptulonate synthase [Fimbriimonadaceae bacterium]|nr:3-deoxy-7-phosphoheptulonate synthase [Fimbriimonadaceae bacterium]
MIVVFKFQAQTEEVARFRQLLEGRGAMVEATTLGGRDLFSVECESPSLAAEVSSLAKASSAVSNCIPTNHPFPLVAKTEARSSVPVGHAEFGGPSIVVMAGPCSVESEAQIHQSARTVAEAGATVLRGGAFKPSTSPYGFSGLGAEALSWLRDAARSQGLLAISEVMDPRKVDLVAEHVDILQIGARNMQNFDLLREVGMSGHPVLLKRGFAARTEEWFLAAEHIAVAGGQKIILCERGIRTFESSTRNTLDIAAIPVAHRETCLPVAVDPSHAAGHRDLVPSLALAAVAAGVDALLIEVHPEPEKSIKDGAQSLSPEEFSALMEDLRRIAPALGRSVSSLVSA